MPQFSSPQKALFLDRDGVINIDRGYVSKIDDFEFPKWIFELIECFRDAGCIIFIVTNQSGIGRGYYSESDFHILTDWMLQEFKSRDIMIEKVLYCPHDPSAGCHCRKPNIGMIEQALLEYSIDLENSWMIGDKSSDIKFASNGGIGNSIYIGQEPSVSATLSFGSVQACASFFQENTGKI